MGSTRATSRGNHRSEVRACDSSHICELWSSRKYVSYGPHDFREEDFLSFSYYKSMGANDPRSVASLDPRALIGMIYVGDH